MKKLGFKNISTLLIGLLLLVDSSMIETMFVYFKASNRVETSVEKLQHKDEPSETNPKEKYFEKSEFIIEDLNSLINSLSFFVFKSYPFIFSMIWTNRAISVLTPPPNLV